MRTRIIISALLCCFALSSFAQNSKPLQDYEYYGNYYMKPMVDMMMYPAIVNRQTGKYVYQPLTSIPKPGQSQNEIGNKAAPFVVSLTFNLGFLKPVKTSKFWAHPIFEGLVWLDDYDASNSHYSEEKGKWEFGVSGIYKIENEQLVPLLVTKGNRDKKVFPLQDVPFVALQITYRNEAVKGKKKKKLQEVDSIVTRVFDSDFEFVKELDGKIIFDGVGNILVHKDGRRDTLDFSNIITSGPFQDEQGRWGIRDKRGNTVVPCVMTQEEVWESYHNRDIWSFTRYCKQHTKKKSEFETQAEYEARMNDAQLQQKYITQKGIDKKFFSGYSLSLGRYDIETETFPVNGYMLFVQGMEPVVTDIPWNDFRIKVPRSEAEAFKNNWKTISQEALKNAKIGIRYDAPAIEEITFNGPDGKTYNWKRE